MGDFLLPFLNIGIMLADSQSFGKIPDLRNWVNIICRIGAIYFAHVIKIRVGILSGPAALPALRFFRRDTIPLVLNVMLGMAGYELKEEGGILLFSLVKLRKIGPQVLLL